MVAFMDMLEERFGSEGFSDNTKRQYKGRLMKLNKGKNFRSFTFLHDPKKIMERMAEFKWAASSQESHLGTIISVLKMFPTKRNRGLRAKYEAIIKDGGGYYTKKDKSVKSAKQEENWLSKDELKEYTDRYRKQATDPDATYEAIFNQFILSLYTDMPPKRNMDYIKTKVGEDSGIGNWYVPKTNQFIIREYKTSKIYGTQKINLADYPLVQESLDRYMKVRNPDAEELLITEGGKALTLSNQITRILNKIFGKGISSSMLRSFYISHKNHNGVIDEMKADSLAMGHSLATQQNVYNKAA